MMVHTKFQVKKTEAVLAKNRGWGASDDELSTPLLEGKGKKQNKVGVQEGRDEEGAEWLEEEED